MIFISASVGDTLLGFIRDNGVRCCDRSHVCTNRSRLLQFLKIKLWLTLPESLLLVCSGCWKITLGTTSAGREDALHPADLGQAVDVYKFFLEEVFSPSHGR